MQACPFVLLIICTSLMDVRVKKAWLCINETNYISRHVWNTAAHIKKLIWRLHTFKRVKIEYFQGLLKLYKSPSGLIKGTITLPQGLFNKLPRSFISSFHQSTNLSAFCLTWIGLFLFFSFWWLSHLSEKAFADSSESCRNLLLALSSLKLLYHPTILQLSSW